MIYLHCSKFQYTCISAFGRIIYVIPMCIVEKKEIERGKKGLFHGPASKQKNQTGPLYIML